MQLSDLAEDALGAALKLGVSDASILAIRGDEKQVRFSNNSVTLANNVRNIWLEVYVAKNRRRIIGSTSNPTSEGVRGFVADLVKSCEALAESPDYTPLPRGPFTYLRGGVYDPAIEADGNALLDFARRAIDAGRQAGAQRVSGSLKSAVYEYAIRTSGGVGDGDKRSEILLNVRAFAEGNASGHGLSCAPRLADFRPTEAGRTAGAYAKRAVGAKTVPEGTYQVLFSPTVVADIISHVGGAASAFSVDAGFSFLADKLQQPVGVDTLTITDDAFPEGGFGGRRFDDEGVSTGRHAIIERGIVRNYLHNSTTARKFQAQTTGNAGVIAPHPWNLVVAPGQQSWEELVREIRRGVIITNNWYTRFQNPRAGEYSTMPRDAAFYVEQGEIRFPVAELRVSDSILRQLQSILALGRERAWIEWWEVPTPTLTPAFLVDGVQITRAVG